MLMDSPNQFSEKTCGSSSYIPITEFTSTLTSEESFPLFLMGVSDMDHFLTLVR